MAALLCLLACAAAPRAAAQGSAFKAQPLSLGTLANTGRTATLDITLTRATAIQSIAMPFGFVGDSEFVVTDKTGCVIDGTTINASGTVCHVTVFFLPRMPGFRFASVIITDGAGAQTAFGVYGSGNMPMVAMYPSVARVVAGVGPTAAGYSGDGGSALLAKMSAPAGMAADSFGNVYFSDSANSRVRMLDVFGNVTSVAGGGTLQGAAADGQPATSAKLVLPTFLAVDMAGNLYISETGSHVVRRVAMSTSRTITTVAGSYTSGFTDNVAATSAKLNTPTGIAVDFSGDLFIADNANHRIRMVSSGSGVISTVAGDGTVGPGVDGGSPSTAKFSSFIGGLVSDGGSGVYIADMGNHQVRSYAPGLMLTVAGAGTAGSSGDGGDARMALLSSPKDLAFDASYNLYITDAAAGVVRKVNNRDHYIQTIAGDASNAGGFTSGAAPSTSVQMSSPSGVTFDPLWNLYIADGGNNVIRQVPPTPAELVFPTLAPGVTSSPVTVRVSNIGTYTSFLPFNGIVALNSQTSANYTFDNSGPSACTAVQGAGGQADCTFTVTFQPQQSGFIAGEFDLLTTLPSGVAARAPVYLAGGTATPLAIGPDTLPFISSGETYSQTVSVIGGYGTVSADTLGTLPAGITVSRTGNDFLLSGTSTATGLYAFTVFATDALGGRVAKTYDLRVTPPPLPLNDDETISVSDAVTANLPVLLTDDETIGVHDAVTANLPALLTDDETIGVHDAITTTSTKLSQTITAPSLGGHAYGEAPFDVSGTSSSSLPVSVSVTSGPATVANNLLDLTAAGTVQLMYTQAGDSTYNPATPVVVSFTAQRASATVVAVNLSRGYGHANPSLAYSINGLVHGDSAIALGTPLLTTNAGLNSPAGNYPIHAGAGTLSTVNYKYTYVDGVLTVNGNALQIITFPPIPSAIPLSFHALNMTAHSTSGLPITYSVSGPATVSGSHITFTGTGVVTITANQAGNANFGPATPISRTFTVTP